MHDTILLNDTEENDHLDKMHLLPSLYDCEKINRTLFYPSHNLQDSEKDRSICQVSSI